MQSVTVHESVQSGKNPFYYLPNLGIFLAPFDWLIKVRIIDNYSMSAIGYEMIDTPQLTLIIPYLTRVSFPELFY